MPRLRWGRPKGPRRASRAHDHAGGRGLETTSRRLPPLSAGFFSLGITHWALIAPAAARASSRRSFMPASTAFPFGRRRATWPSCPTWTSSPSQSSGWSRRSAGSGPTSGTRRSSRISDSLSWPRTSSPTPSVPAPGWRWCRSMGAGSRSGPNRRDTTKTATAKSPKSRPWKPGL